MVNAVPVIAVVDVAALAVLNHQNKAKVQAEFTRRRLGLPLCIAPGATTQGSWFFPITAGPRRLIVRGAIADAPVELVLDLAPLAGLNVKP